MDAISCRAAKADLAKTMDRVCEDREPIVITRRRGQSVVLLSLDDFNAMQETAHLLRSPANARRLLSAAEQLAAEKGRNRAGSR